MQWLLAYTGQHPQSKCRSTKAASNKTIRKTSLQSSAMISLPIPRPQDTPTTIYHAHKGWSSAVLWPGTLKTETLSVNEAVVACDHWNSYLQATIRHSLSNIGDKVPITLFRSLLLVPVKRKAECDHVPSWLYHVCYPFLNGPHSRFARCTIFSRIPVFSFLPPFTIIDSHYGTLPGVCKWYKFPIPINWVSIFGISTCITHSTTFTDRMCHRCHRTINFRLSKNFNGLSKNQMLRLIPSRRCLLFHNALCLMLRLPSLALRPLGELDFPRLLASTLRDYVTQSIQPNSQVKFSSLPSDQRRLSSLCSWTAGLSPICFMGSIYAACTSKPFEQSITLW